MSEIPPFTILDAFTRAEILCSMGIGPDGSVDSQGGAYEASIYPNLDRFLTDLVGEAGDLGSVVIEFQTHPQVDDLGHVHACYTLREQIPQEHVPS